MAKTPRTPGRRRRRGNDPQEDGSSGEANLDSTWFRVLVLANSVGLIVVGMNQPTTYEAKHDSTDEVDWIKWGLFIAAIAVLAVEIGLRVWFQGLKPWGRNVFNWLDPFVLVTCAGALARPDQIPAGFALLRIFRILAVATQAFNLDGPAVVAESMVYSPRVLGQLCLYLTYWCFFFALMGLEFYHGSLARRCVDDQQQLRALPETFCGSTGGAWGGSRRCQTQYNHSCEDWGNPYHGQAGYDDILDSLLAVFSIATMSDWIFYVKALSEAEYTVSVLYPILIIIVLSLIAVNLFLSAVVFGFSRVSARRAQAAEERLAALEDSLLEDEATLGIDPKPDHGPLSSTDEEPPASQTCREKLASFLAGIVFERILISVIVANSLLLATYSAGMSDTHKDVINYGEMVFTALYIIEAGVKIYAMGPRGYYNDPWNRFDFAITLLSAVEAGLEVTQVSQFRVIRLVRTVRLTRNTASASGQSMLGAMWESVEMTLWVFAMLLAIMFVYGLAMYQLYADKFDGLFAKTPRSNFDTILSSMLCMAQTVTSDTWEPIMYNAMDNDDTGWAAPSCFISCYVVCNFLVINLFVASILESIEIPEETEPEPEKDDRKCFCNDNALWLLGPESKVRTSLQSLTDSVVYERIIMAHVLISCGVLVFDKGGEDPATWDDYLTAYLSIVFSIDILIRTMAHNFLLGPRQSESSGKAPFFRQSSYTVLYSTATLLMWGELATHAAFPDASLRKVGRVARPLRLLYYAPKGVKGVVDSFVAALPLLFSTVLIANAVWFCFAVAGTIWFSGLLGSCNDGTVAGKEDCRGVYSYSRDTFSPKLTDIPVPRVWKTWWRNFDDIFQTYLTLFEVASLDTWAEVMYACMDITAVDKQPERNNKLSSCVFFVIFMIVGAYLMLQLFVAVVVHSYCRMKSEEQGLLNELQHQYHSVGKILKFNQPERVPGRPLVECGGLRPLMYDLCVPWDKFDDDKSAAEAVEGKDQGEDRGEGGGQSKSKWKRFMRSHFEDGVLLLIMMNLLMMATRHSDMGERWKNALSVSSMLFSLVFGVELVMKLLAYSPRRYLKNPWNAFDAVVVIACVGTAPFEGSSFATIPNVLRGVRLLNQIKTFRMLTTQLLSSISRIANVAMVLAFLLFTYAVAGIEFFGQTRYGTALSATYNFQHFGRAVLTLWRVTFGDWVYLRHDCQVSPPDCTDGQDCGSVMAAPFFFTLLLLNSYIIANIFVAVVLTDFSWLYASEVGVSHEGIKGMLSAEQMDEIISIWTKFDPWQKGYLEDADLEPFMLAVDPPLGYKNTAVGQCTLEEIRAECAAFPLAKGGQLRFRELLSVMALNALGREAAPANHWLRAFQRRDESSLSVGMQMNPLQDDGETPRPERSCLQEALDMDLDVNRMMGELWAGVDMERILPNPRRINRLDAGLDRIANRPTKFSDHTVDSILEPVIEVGERALLCFLVAFETALRHLMTRDGESLWPPAKVRHLVSCRHAVQESWTKALRMSMAGSFEEGLSALVLVDYGELVIQEHCKHREPGLEEALEKTGIELLEKVAELMRREYAPAVRMYEQRVDAMLTAGEEAAKQTVQQELDEVIPVFFERYDLDDSDTLNSFEEVDNLCTNLAYSYGLYIAFPPAEEITMACKLLELSRENPWDLGEFTEWFNESIRNRTSVKKTNPMFEFEIGVGEKLDVVDKGWQPEIDVIHSDHQALTDARRRPSYEPPLDPDEYDIEL